MPREGAGRYLPSRGLQSLHAAHRSVPMTAAIAKPLLMVFEKVQMSGATPYSRCRPPSVSRQADDTSSKTRSAPLASQISRMR